MRRRNRSGTLIPIIILALFIGGIASFFDRTKTSDEIIEENGTVWGDEYTSLDEFEYYVNGDEIIITDHIGDSQMLNIKMAEIIKNQKRIHRRLRNFEEI